MLGVPDMNTQENSSNRIGDSTEKIHCSSSEVSLIIDQSQKKCSSVIDNVPGLIGMNMHDSPSEDSRDTAENVRCP